MALAGQMQIGAKTEEPKIEDVPAKVQPYTIGISATGEIYEEEQKVDPKNPSLFIKHREKEREL